MAATSRYRPQDRLRMIRTAMISLRLGMILLALSAEARGRSSGTALPSLGFVVAADPQRE